MAPIPPQAGLLRYVRKQGEAVLPSGSVLEALAVGTYVAGKIKFQIGICL